MSAGTTIDVAGTAYNPVELCQYATAVRDAHDPANQDHNYNRCAECHFTRHPCETFDMASAVLELIKTD